MDIIIIAGIIIILLFLTVIIRLGVRIVGPKQKLIVTRRGKYLFATKPNSMYLIFPFINKVKRVDISEYDEYMKNNYPTISCRKCHSDSIPYNTETCPYCGKKL